MHLRLNLNIHTKPLQSMDFEGILMQAFKAKGVLPEIKEDDQEDDEAAGFEEELEKTKDEPLEWAAACGFNVGSQSAMGKRYALFRRSCAEENRKYEEMEAHQKKKRVREWCEQQYDEYQDRTGGGG